MKFPWTKRREENDAKLAQVLYDLREMKEHMRTVQNVLSRPAPELPGPLVCVLVEAWAADHMADMGLTTLGTSARAQRGKNITLETCVPLRNGRVTIFSDFEKVEFRGVYLGQDILFAGGDWAPVLAFKTWKVGQRLAIICEPRTS